MVRFRNDHGEDRVVPTLGYVLVPAGDTVTVADDQWEHWQAGGWTPLDPDPRPAPEPDPPAAKPAAAPIPAPAVSAPPAPVAPAAVAAAVPADSEVKR